MKPVRVTANFRPLQSMTLRKMTKTHHAVYISTVIGICGEQRAHIDTLNRKAHMALRKDWKKSEQVDKSSVPYFDGNNSR